MDKFHVPYQAMRVCLFICIMNSIKITVNVGDNYIQDAVDATGKILFFCSLYLIVSSIDFQSKLTEKKSYKELIHTTLLSTL